MSDRLEQFINDHREDFDSEEPASKIWENIRKQTEPARQLEAPVVPLYRMRWSVAAAVLVLIGSAVLYFTLRTGTKNDQPTIAKAKPAIDNNLPKVTPAPVDSGTTQVARQQSVIKPKETVPVTNDQVADMNEEMYHFAKLVEIKQKQLRTIEKDEPLLYRQFAGDVNKLDSVYRSLKQQLPQNANREQLIEAMIQNLQLQMDLLNHQLTIIKQINHSKKSAYENAFKSA
jgi:hypothetical protein